METIPAAQQVVISVVIVLSTIGLLIYAVAYQRSIRGTSQKT
jgi:hypothetical protein